VPLDGTLGFEAVLAVDDASGPSSFHVALTLPAIDAGLVLAEAPSIPIEHGLGPGRVHIAGRTSSLPLIGGRLGLVLGVLDDAGRVLSSASRDFAMEGPLRLGKPMFDLHVDHHLERVTS